MKRLAVFFPGIGYTVDKPLLHYSRRLAEKHGFEIRLLPYGGFPKKVKGDRDRMLECGRLACRQAKEMLADLDYDLGYDSLYSGYHVLVYMKEHGICPGHINIHSTHDTGRVKMLKYAAANFPDALITGWESVY